VEHGSQARPICSIMAVVPFVLVVVLVIDPSFELSIAKLVACPKGEMLSTPQLPDFTLCNQT